MKSFIKKGNKIYEQNEEETTLVYYEKLLTVLEKRVQDEKDMIDKRFAERIQETKDAIKKIKEL